MPNWTNIWKKSGPADAAMDCTGILPEAPCGLKGCLDACSARLPGTSEPGSGPQRSKNLRRASQTGKDSQERKKCLDFIRRIEKQWSPYSPPSIAA